ncbi:MAG: DNA-directed RNA polymerase subunit omega [Oscillospiraceae bacterium]|nr:DNA-directed RNA polymerase subunit omega [Oscillospiraceae bacterium]
MMIKPGITELSKCVDSRYTLVTMAAKRARMIGKHNNSEDNEIDYNHEKDKPVSIAANEIAGGKVGYVRSEAVALAAEWEAEKTAAIHSLGNSETEEERTTEEISEEEESETDN